MPMRVVERYAEEAADLARGAARVFYVEEVEGSASRSVPARLGDRKLRRLAGAAGLRCDCC